MAVEISLSLTGVMTGEIVVGREDEHGVVGSSFIVLSGEIPPLLSVVSMVSEGQWPQITAFMQQRPYFAKMTPTEVRQWMREHASPLDKHIDQWNVIVGDLVLSGDDFDKQLTEQQRETFGSPNPKRKDGGWSLSEVYDSLARQSERAKRQHERKQEGATWRHSLVFRPRLWTIQPSATAKVTIYEGQTIDLTTGIVLTGRVEATDGKSLAILHGVVPSESGRYAVLFDSQTDTGQNRRDLTTYYPLIIDRTRTDVETLERLRQLFLPFSPLFHKSLMQKVIRTGAVTLYDIHDAYMDEEAVFTDYDGLTVLLFTFCALLVHPGALNPELSRYETGAEAALKRSAVSIMEDSWLNEKTGANQLIKLLTSGLLCTQLKRKFFPSVPLVADFLDTLVEAYHSPKLYDYKTRPDPPASVSKGAAITPYSLCHLLLAEARSFETDITLAAWIAYNNGRPSAYEAPSFVEALPFIHAIDQHNYTDFVYYIDPSHYQHLIATSPAGTAKTPDDFTALMGIVWDRSSGVNPRRERYSGKRDSGSNGPKSLPHYLDLEEDEFVRHLRYAQYLVFKMKVGENNRPRNPVSPSEMRTLSYEIDQSWLSGLLGPIDLKTNATKTLRICLDPKDIYDRKVGLTTTSKRAEKASKVKASKQTANAGVATTAATSTSRKDDDSVPEPQKRAALTLFDIKLKEGIPLLPMTSLPQLRGASLSWKDDEYLIIFPDGRTAYWSDLLTTTVNATVLSAMEPDRLNGSLYWSNGIDSDADRKLGAILSSLTPNELLALYRTLASATATIEFPHVSRGGKGSEQVVRTIDVKMNELLSALVVLYPFALKKTAPIVYTVLHTPFIVWLRQRVWDLKQATAKGDQTVNINRSITQSAVKGKKASKSGSDTNGRVWSPIAEKRGYVLYPFQTEAVEDVLGSNRRAHLIGMEGGSGKSKIVMEIISQLITANLLPDYVLWLIPPSAEESIIAEIEGYGALYNLIDTRVKPGKWTGTDDTVRPVKNGLLKKGVINIAYQDHLKVTKDTPWRQQVLDHIYSLTPNLFTILDEFHLCLDPTIRTSSMIEISRLSHTFIGLSGTPLKDNNIESAIPFLQQMIEFPVTRKNFWAAYVAMIARRINYPFEIYHGDAEAQLTDEELAKEELLVLDDPLKRDYASFKQRLELYYAACSREIIRMTVEALGEGKTIFLVSRNYKDQQAMHDALVEDGVDPSVIFLIGHGSSINLQANDGQPYRVVITTPSFSAGYTVTKASLMITPVIAVNQATKTQLDHRIIRLSQRAPRVEIITVHAGILTNVFQRYEKTRNLHTALKSIADEMKLPMNVWA